MNPWLFGYGSLIWRPDFAYLQRTPASIRGWSRRFWQASPDHRGTPERPGRVVTLSDAPGERCAGMAYQIDAAVWEPIREALDHREKAGYEHHRVRITTRDAGVVDGLVYVAGPANPNFTGPAPIDQIAARIRDCTGPSGPNREYLRELARALRELGEHDAHVFELDDALRSILG